MPVTRGRALIACGLEDVAIVMATDLAILAFDCKWEGNYLVDIGFPEPPGFGLWLWRPKQ